MPSGSAPSQRAAVLRRPTKPADVELTVGVADIGLTRDAEQGADGQHVADGRIDMERVAAHDSLCVASVCVTVAATAAFRDDGTIAGLVRNALAPT